MNKDKEALRHSVDEQMDAFLKKGGTIEKIETGLSGEDQAKSGGYAVMPLTLNHFSTRIKR